MRLQSIMQLTARWPSRLKIDMKVIHAGKPKTTEKKTTTKNKDMICLIKKLRI